MVAAFDMTTKPTLAQVDDDYFKHFDEWEWTIPMYRLSSSSESLREETWNLYCDERSC